MIRVAGDGDGDDGLQRWCMMSRGCGDDGSQMFSVIIIVSGCPGSLGLRGQPDALLSGDLFLVSW